jgi:metal-dependent amidase/aminoacylase/carboxypeptidase family protein
LGASSTRTGTATTAAVDEVLSGYAGLQAAQEAFYKDLHAHPELSHHEHRTAPRVASELERCGLTVQTLLPLFRPAEKTGDGARGIVGTCPGPFMSAEDGIAITVYGAAATAHCRRTPSTRWCWPR